MPNITDAWDWAVQTCNDPNVGYWMDHRYQETINGITYYDCSSFIWYALVQGGGFALPSPAFTTVNMYSVLNAAGFTIIVPTASTLSQAGDILWYDNGGGVNGHTEMVFAGGVGEARTMGAHGRNGIQLENQVSINSGYTPYSYYGWQYLARIGNVSYQWHNKDYGAYSRSNPEAQENVMKIVEVLAGLGFSVNAMAGIIGNIEAESGLNPWRWESDTVNLSGGYGLLQYTPATKYIGNGTAQGFTEYAPNYPVGSGGQDDGTAQLKFLDATNTAEYFPTSAYPLTYSQFKESTQSPDYLAAAWLYNYERPLDPSATIAARQANAVYWYNFITTHPWQSPNGRSLYGLKRAQLLHRKRRNGY